MLKNVVTLLAGVEPGLTRATAALLAKKGSKIIICDKPTSGGKQIASDIGGNVSFIPTDLSNDSDVENALRQINKKYKRLDVVVNCNSVKSKPVRTYDFQNDVAACLQGFTDTVMSTHNAFNVTRLAAGKIGLNHVDGLDLRGLFIFTVGIEDKTGLIGQTANVAASGAVAAMTKPIAADLCSRGIRVVTIRPETYFPENSANNQQIRLVEPDEYAHLVQTIIMNQHINDTVIDLPARIKPTS